MAVILREVFVDMYSEDVLEKFKEIMPILSNTNQNKVPELPVKGNLDIQKVKESEYFFC